MQRTAQIKYPTLIASADWHLREDIPECYLGDYWQDQWAAVDFIKDLQLKYNCPVVCAGDLFDHWKPSPNLIREAIIHMPKQFYTIYGQHDLPQHNLQLADKCGINVLKADKTLTVLPECHWDQTPKEGSLYLPNFNCHILVWHIMNYTGKEPWPGAPIPMAAKLLRQYPQFPLIITGDNHKTFHEDHEGRWLINPGSLMRMKADQVDHKPCVYLWFAEDNSIQQVYIPIKQGIISREHIEKEEERDARIDAFVTRLDTDWEAALSFRQNVETFKLNNQVRTSVMAIVYKAMEPIKTVS
jgi:DNA repair exonuclease SbcCD nuclease subunit